LRLPEGVKLFSGKPGTYRLDFMSFVAGKGNPRAEEGESYFERTFFVHQGIGPNQDWHLCMAKTMKKPCPVCEHRAKMSADPEADENVIKALAPKERQLWIVKDLLNDPDSVLIWEVSYHLFGRMLKDKINNADEEDGYDYFADPTDGLTMRLALQQSDKGKWIETADIEFRPRKQKYDTAIIEEMPCLDDLLAATPYDKLKAIFLQTDEDREEEKDAEEQRPARTKTAEESDEKEDRPAEKKPGKKPKRREFSAGDEVGYKGMRCEVLKVSGDGTSLMLEDPDGEILKAVDAREIQELGPKQADRPSPTKKDETKESADDWDSWDDEPEQKKTKAASGKKRSEEEEEPDEPESKKKPKKGDDDDWDSWD